MTSIGGSSHAHGLAVSEHGDTMTPSYVEAANIEEEIAMAKQRLAFLEEIAMLKNRIALLESARASSSATHIKHMALSLATRALDKGTVPIYEHFEDDPIYDDYGDVGPLYDDSCDEGPLYDDFGDEDPLYDDFGDEGPLYDDYGANEPLAHLLAPIELEVVMLPTPLHSTVLEAPSPLVCTPLSPPPPFSFMHPLPPPMRLPFFIDFDEVMPPPPPDMVSPPSHAETKSIGISSLMDLPESCDKARSPPRRERGFSSSSCTTMRFFCSQLVGKLPHSTFVFKKGRDTHSPSFPTAKRGRFAFKMGRMIALDHNPSKIRLRLSSPWSMSLEPWPYYPRPAGDNPKQ